MTLEDRIVAFDQLGRILERYLNSLPGQDKTICLEDVTGSNSYFLSLFNKIEIAIKEAELINPWFTRENILASFYGISRILNLKNLNLWLKSWSSQSLSPRYPLKIGVIMAGNFPLAGFHDFLSILITGHTFIGKPSSRDDRLLPMMGNMLAEIQKDFTKRIEFTDEKLSGTNAIIATGSNNTYRYFEYYFGKYPHIFRKNRNGVAILQGNETPEQLAHLGKDIFTYFGLGCRNVSKIFIPDDYQFNPLFDALEKFSYLTEHYKYMNNYMYYKSVYLLNKIPHFDNGFLILKPDKSYHSPIGVLFYEFYSSIEKCVEKLISDRDLLQCIAATELAGLKTVPFGKTQFPELWDYADNVNTIDFLINL